MRSPLPLCVLVLALASCGDARGVLVTGDGRVVPVTAEAYRDETALTIAAAVQPALPPGTTVAVAIDELPRFGAARRDPADRWRWAEVHARVAVSGARAAETDAAAITALAKRVLSDKTDRRDRIHVAVTSGAEVAVAAPAAAAPAQAAPVAPSDAPRSVAARTYTARVGDTLADLSLAFYGSPDHWRLIRDANPTIDFAALAGGEAIVIPAR